MTILTLTMNPALDIATATDRVVPGHKLRCAPPRYDAGGGGINVARAVHALGGEAIAVFPVGGAAGEMIRRLLDGEGVRYRAIPVAGLTRESLAVEEHASGKQYRFILPGPEISAPERERCLDELAGLLPRASHVVASGSLPPGVPEDFYARVRALAQRFGKPLLLDTSGKALEQAGNGIWLLKPSLRELEHLSGRPIHGRREQEKATRDLVAQGRAEIIVLSLGAEGALLVTQHASERIAAVPVATRTTIGAGDSMLAGIVFGLSRGMALREAVRYGVAAGAAALLRPGTALCRREDVERLYALAAASDRAAG